MLGKHIIKSHVEGQNSPASTFQTVETVGNEVQEENANSWKSGNVWLGDKAQLLESECLSRYELFLNITHGNLGCLTCGTFLADNWVRHVSENHKRKVSKDDVASIQELRMSHPKIQLQLGSEPIQGLLVQEGVCCITCLNNQQPFFSSTAKGMKGFNKHCSNTHPGQKLNKAAHFQRFTNETASFEVHSICPISMFFFFFFFFSFFLSFFLLPLGLHFTIFFLLFTFFYYYFSLLCASS